MIPFSDSTPHPTPVLQVNVRACTLHTPGTHSAHMGCSMSKPFLKMIWRLLIRAQYKVRLRADTGGRRSGLGKELEYRGRGLCWSCPCSATPCLRTTLQLPLHPAPCKSYLPVPVDWLQCQGVVQASLPALLALRVCKSYFPSAWAGIAMPAKEIGKCQISNSACFSFNISLSLSVLSE